MGWNEGWVQLGTGCGEGGAPPGCSSQYDDGWLVRGWPLQGLAVWGEPVHPRSERRVSPPRSLRQATWALLDPPGTLLRPQPCAIPENSTTKGINRWCLTTCK